MKEKVLTNAELGSYAYGNELYSMEFAWNNSCHNKNHGYTSANYGCNNTDDYANSKIRELLEGTYINTLGASNLKLIDGYKIRLITIDELVTNLGCTNSCSSSQYGWVYQNLGGAGKGVEGYWTMTRNDSNANHRLIWYVSNRSGLNYNFALYESNGIRPVINLLKSSIE